MVWSCTLVPVVTGQRQVGLWEFKASLFYISISRAYSVKREKVEGQGEREIEVEGREERTVFFLFGRFLFISLSEKKHFFSSEYDRA